MPLSALAAKQAKPKHKDYKLSDGAGLYLLVRKTGAKYWRLKYRFSGKEKTLALGVFPEVTLADARTQRDEARQLLASKIDPSVSRRAAKAAGNDAEANSFEVIAAEWFATKMADKSESYRERTQRLLSNDLTPRLGRRPVGDISPPELLAVLRRIEARGANETAHKAKQVAGMVVRYAIATGRAERDPSADLKDALKPPKRGHFSAITDPQKLGRLLVDIDGYAGTPTVRTALALAPLLFVRPNELRHMEWSEIDAERWELPAEKMKTSNPHIVPLAPQALALIEDLRPITGRGRYVFPSVRSTTRPLSENALRVALRTMGYGNDEVTAHGFRATARTLLDEVLEYRIEWIECQLAHAVKDANGRAYNRTSYIKQRTKMMAAWANYLDDLRAAARSENVISAEFGSVPG